jgi:hypothetical protein
MTSDLGRPGPAVAPSAPAGSLSRRQVLTSGTVGIASLTLPAATAAASGEAITPASVSTLTFTEVTETGFTVSWA